MKHLVFRFFPLVVLITVFAGHFAAGSPASSVTDFDNPAPEAYFQFRVDPANPAHVIFSDLSLYHPNQWRWHFGDGFGSQEDDTEHTYTESGTFLACLTVTNPSGSDTACETITISGLTANQEVREVRPRVTLAPNPARAFFLLESQDRFTGEFILSDLQGRKIKSWSSASVGQLARLFLPSVPPGLYLVSGRTERGRFVKRLMID